MIWLEAGAIAVGLALLALFAINRWAARTQGLSGALVTNAPAAPDFSLTDQNGQIVHMQNLRGKTVALTFLYTHCPDVCPLIASTLSAADHRLAGQQSHVQMLAVSVDPVGDTPEAIHKFDDDRGLSDLSNWHYLTGSPSQLASVWQAYGGIEDPALAGKTLSADQIEHMAIIYLIDPQGHMRVALPANFSASDLLDDVSVLSH